jgi:large subunit ribosomal protein L13
MKTFSAKAGQVERRWYVIDAEKKVVGRVAEKAAMVLRGKHKAIFTPHVDAGDFVVVINAGKAVLTGKKEDQKTYMSYSSYIGGEKLESARKRRERRPELLIQSAVKGMVPHNRLGRQVLKKLHVYAGSEHPHAAQNPEPLSL